MVLVATKGATLQKCTLDTHWHKLGFPGLPPSSIYWQYAEIEGDGRGPKHDGGKAWEWGYIGAQSGLYIYVNLVLVQCNNGSLFGKCYLAIVCYTNDDSKDNHVSENISRDIDLICAGRKRCLVKGQQLSDCDQLGPWLTKTASRTSQVFLPLA